MQPGDDERGGGLVDAYAPPDVRDDLLAGLRAADVADAVDGSMFLTERDGGSDLGRTVHCTARDLGDGRVEITGEKWFCSNVDGAAIVMLARPEGAPDGPAGLGLYLVPRVLEDGSPQPLLDPPAEAEAGDEVGAHRRGRVPRRPRLRAPPPGRRRGRGPATPAGWAG